MFCQSRSGCRIWHAWPGLLWKTLLNSLDSYYGVPLGQLFGEAGTGTHGSSLVCGFLCRILLVEWAEYSLILNTHWLGYCVQGNYNPSFGHMFCRARLYHRFLIISVFIAWISYCRPSPRARRRRKNIWNMADSGRKKLCINIRKILWTDQLHWSKNLSKLIQVEHNTPF